MDGMLEPTLSGSSWLMASEELLLGLWRGRGTGIGATVDGSAMAEDYL